MLGIAMVLAGLAIVKKYAPLLLPLAFGRMIANIPLAGLSSHEGGGLRAFCTAASNGESIPRYSFCAGTLPPLVASPKSALMGLAGKLDIFAALGGPLLAGRALVAAIPGFEGFSL